MHRRAVQRTDIAKKKRNPEGAALKVPPKEEDLEECALALGELRHGFIMPNGLWV